MRKVWKYPLGPGTTELSVPPDNIVLHVGLDPVDRPCVWIEVDPEGVQVPYSITVIGTGWPFAMGSDGPVVYLGSFVQGAFVWHAYTGIELPA